MKIARTISLLVALLLAVGAHAATFQVTNIDDAGVGSLRDAIDQANATPGADQIVFAIPGAGPHVIQPLTELPPLTEAVAIDGTSQDDIVLDGGKLGSPEGPLPFIAILSDGSTVKGLEIRGFFRFGILIVGIEGSASDNIIEDNHIHSINGGVAVLITSNGTGVSISGNIIKGNELDNNVSGVTINALEFGGTGSTVSANIVKDNHIHDNSITGVGLFAIDVGGSPVSGNVIENNHIHNNGGFGFNPTSAGITLIAADFVDNEIEGTLSGNTVRGNNIHDNAPQGIVLFVENFEGETAILSNNTFADNIIEANDGWGVEILEEGGSTVVDNIFTNNTFADNGLGPIHGRVQITAVQQHSWGEIKAESK